MNIHKLNAKPKTIPPKTIQWRPLQEVKYPARKVNSMTSEVFNQKDIEFNPKEVKHIQLGLGFMMSEGVVLVGLSNSLKYKRCSLQNEVYLEDTEDIEVTLTNNSREIVTIRENEFLCRVCYKKFIILIINGKERREYISDTTYSSSH